jgi:hypothetical protein
MEELIKQAFLHVDVIGPHVLAGHYDLLGPDGEIILPSVWNYSTQPGDYITMHMWPMDRDAPSTNRTKAVPPPRTAPPRKTWQGLLAKAAQRDISSAKEELERAQKHVNASVPREENEKERLDDVNATARGGNTKARTTREEHKYPATSPTATK